MAKKSRHQRSIETSIKLRKKKLSDDGKTVVKRLGAVIEEIEQLIEWINCDIAPIVLRMDKAIVQLLKAKDLAE
jgi:hypothetical protein